MNLTHHNTSMTASLSACRQNQYTSVDLTVQLPKHGEACLICPQVLAGTSLMLSIPMIGSCMAVKTWCSCAAQPAPPHCRSLPSQPCHSHQHEQQPATRRVEYNQKSNVQEGRLQVWHSSTCSVNTLLTNALFMCCKDRDIKTVHKRAWTSVILC